MKIFKINDCDWYAAETMEEAIRQCSEDTGIPVGEVEDGAYQVADDALDILIFRDEDRPEEEITFRDELQRMVDAGTEFPCAFASTEY
jgi:hypothetical protein